MTSYRGTGAKSAAAIVEIDCSPSDLASITADLARDHHVISIDQTAGSRDLIATVLCGSDAELSMFLVDRITTVPGIIRTRAHHVIKLTTDASSWRLRSLQEQEVNLLERSVPLPHPGPSTVSDDVEKALINILLIDGRATIADLSQWLGITAARAKIALSDVLGRQRVVVRPEIARTFSPYPISVWYFVRAPAAKVEIVAARLAGLQEARLVVTTAGSHSIVILVWLRRIEDMSVLERQLGERLPAAEITDRSVVLRTPKHVGKRLRPDGRRLI